MPDDKKIDLSTLPEPVRKLIQSIERANPGAVRGVQVIKLGDDDTPPTERTTPIVEDGKLTEAAFAKDGKGEPAHFDLRWSDWRKIMAEASGDAPGWSPCRFATRNMVDGKAVFLLGAVRGCYGVHTSPIRCCEFQVGDFDEVLPDPMTVERHLTHLTHLPTGVFAGLFASRAEAMACAEIAERAVGSVAWGEGDEAFEPLLDKIFEAWKAMGVRVKPDTHAHPPNTIAAIPIMYIDAEAVNEGRPEKVS